MKIYSLDRQSKVTDYSDLTIIEGKKEVSSIKVSVSRYEFYVQQLLLYSKYPVKNAAVYADELKSEDGNIASDSVISLLTEGINADGKRRNGLISFNAGVLQPVFFGLDISKVALGVYKTVLHIGNRSVPMTIAVKDYAVFDYGADAPETLTRLRWLNSTVARDSAQTQGYERMSADGNTFGFTGKTVYLENNGMIGNVVSFFDKGLKITDSSTAELFFRPVIFSVEGQKFKFSKQRYSPFENSAEIYTEGKSDALKIETAALATYEGAFDYVIKLTALKGFITENITLDFCFKSCKYISGLGAESGKFNEVNLKWDMHKNRDSVYIGDVNCGAVVKFKANDYRRPLNGDAYCNLPIRAPRDSWDNYGQGSVEVYKTDEGAVLSASTGRVVMPEGSTKEFSFEIRFTPFKSFNINRSFGVRTYHPKKIEDSVNTVGVAGAHTLNYIDVPEGTELNPFVCYPYASESAMKEFVKAAHEKHIGVKPEYSPRSLSAHAEELAAFKAFGEELILRERSASEKGGNKFLDGTFGDNYVPGKAYAVVSPSLKKPIEEASVMTVPGSRMENYYVEGAAYLLGKGLADGFLVKNPTAGRNTMERIKKLCERKNGLPGIVDYCFDNTEALGKGGTSALLTAAEILPFADKLWLDKDYDFANRSIDYTLVEGSGLIYGLSAEFGEGVNPLYALLFGAVARYGAYSQHTDAEVFEMYKLLDGFGIKDSIMYGFWDERNPVSSDKGDVYVTSFQNGARLMAVVFNNKDKKQEFDLGINPKKGFTSHKKRIFTPDMGKLQKKKTLNFNKPFSLKGKSGMVIIIK